MTLRIAISAPFYLIGSVFLLIATWISGKDALDLIEDPIDMDAQITPLG